MWMHGTERSEPHLQTEKCIFSQSEIQNGPKSPTSTAVIHEELNKFFLLPIDWLRVETLATVECNLFRIGVCNINSRILAPFSSKFRRESVFKDKIFSRFVHFSQENPGALLDEPRSQNTHIMIFKKSSH